tara:strand:+ start:850 stop:1092 length:243 start_codon:yes stop_codon:yes gene_type:complete
MNFSTEISFQILRWWFRFTPFGVSGFDDWGTCINICKLSFGEDGTTDYDKEYSFSLFTYLNVKYLHRLEIFGVDVFMDFR